MVATAKSWAAGVAVAVAVSVSGAGAQSFAPAADGEYDCGAVPPVLFKALAQNLTCKKTGGTLTVSGTGAMRDYILNAAGGSNAPWGEVDTVVIESGVSTIGQYAFIRSGNLVVIVKSANPPTARNNSFSALGQMRVLHVVPKDNIDAYRAADVWKDFFNYINPSTVTFSTGNGSAIPPKLVSYGDTVAKPADPVRDGYVLDYWFLDAPPPPPPSPGVMPSAWDFSTPITSDITLIAYWKTATSVLGSNTPNTANIAVRQTGRELKISTPDRAAASRYGVELYSVSGKRQRVSPVYHADGMITVALPHIAAGSYILRVVGGKSGMDRRILVR